MNNQQTGHPAITQLSPISKVVNVSERREDKNGRIYRLLRLQAPNESKEIVAGQEVTVKERGKEVSINQYESSYLNDQVDPFFNVEEGDWVGIGIYNAQTEPYEITDDETGEVREVTSYTYGVIRGDNPLTVLKNAEREPAGGQVAATETAETSEELEEREEVPSSIT